jgi:hypothetical protein
VSIAEARRQRLAEAIAAQKAATRRVHLILGRRVYVPRDDLQALADMYALTHNDTPDVQAERRRLAGEQRKKP